jgi:curved DNA-binding protein CbpA
MAETFYGALGVADDADSDAIRRAYREQVKEHHPDVSDDPNAPEQFKRLTTARDVLVDADERTRYDRLGHTEYVEKHVESVVWEPTQNGQSAAKPETGSVGSSEETPAASASDGGYDRTAWLGEDGPGKRRQRRRQQRRQRGRQHRRQARRAGATATAEEWQHASKAYRRAETDVTAGQRSPLRTLLNALQSVGPWLFVHLVFLGSAVATSWLAFGKLARTTSGMWTPLVLSFLFVGMAVFASILHVISQVYS